jgi:DNA-binding LytR/AlgR family response regulator
MEKLRIVLVDDEALLLEQMEDIFEKHEKAEIVGAYTNACEALDAIEEQKPDVVFLDVSMPLMDGFQLAERIKRANLEPFIIFVTGHNEFALEAFDAEAVDYIVKPFTKERVLKSIERLSKRVKTHEEKPDNTLQSNWLPVEEGDSIRLISMEDIYYLTADRKKTRVVSKAGVWLTALTLVEIEERYRSKALFRCHKSYIVNIGLIDRIIPMFNQNYIIRMRGLKEEIPVSRHYAKAMMKLLGM